MFSINYFLSKNFSHLEAKDLERGLDKGHCFLFSYFKIGGSSKVWALGDEAPLEKVLLGAVKEGGETTQMNFFVPRLLCL